MLYNITGSQVFNFVIYKKNNSQGAECHSSSLDVPKAGADHCNSCKFFGILGLTTRFIDW